MGRRKRKAKWLLDKALTGAEEQGNYEGFHAGYYQRNLEVLDALNKLRTQALADGQLKMYKAFDLAIRTVESC